MTSNGAKGNEFSLWGNSNCQPKPSRHISLTSSPRLVHQHKQSLVVSTAPVCIHSTAGSFFQPRVACFVSVCLSSGIGTGLFHWSELERREGEVTRPPDFLTLAVLTPDTSCISFSWTGCNICPERWLFALSICADALTLTEHSQTISTLVTSLENLLFSPCYSSLRTSPVTPLATFCLTELHRCCRGGKKSRPRGWARTDRGAGSSPVRR